MIVRESRRERLSSSDKKFYTDYFIWQVVYEVTCHVYIVFYENKSKRKMLPKL